jgi:hypothetical protein
MNKKYKNKLFFIRLQALFNQAPIALLLAIIVSSTDIVLKDFFEPGQLGESPFLSTYLSFLY